MAPPIDYSKWDNIDSESDTAKYSASKTEDKHTMGQPKQCNTDGSERGAAPKSASSKSLAISGRPGQSQDDSPMGGLRWAPLPEPMDYFQNWLTRQDTIKKLIALRGRLWPSADLSDLNQHMDGVEEQYKQGLKATLEKFRGVPHLKERIKVNHGNHITRKERKMQEPPEFGWKVSPGKFGFEFQCQYDSILLLPMAVTTLVFRELTLLQLKAEWDPIIQRITSHLSEIFGASSGTKLEVLVQCFKNFHQMSEEDSLRVFLAVKFATDTHGDFTVYKDDFMILNDSMAVRPALWFPVESCHHTAILAAMFAGPCDIAKFNDACHGGSPRPRYSPADSSVTYGPYSSLKAHINAIRRSFESVAEDILAVLCITVADTNEDRRSYQKRNGALGLDLSHQFALAIGRQGVAIFQSYSFKDIAVGFRRMSFKDWINDGHAEIRSWKEFEAWLSVFETITTHAPTWNANLTNAWRTCFEVDIKRLTNSTESDRAVTGTWCPTLVISEFPCVELQDLDKFEWKLNTYRDKEGWAEVAKHMAVNKYAEPHEMIHMWTPFV